MIVDDHDLIREGLKRVIDHEHDMETVGEAQSGAEGARAAEEFQPAIMLVDVSMPGMSGVELTRVIRATYPAIRVIGVTRHGEPGFVKAMLDAGATGYILKQSPNEELIRAVRSVAAGNRYLDPALTAAESGSAGTSVHASFAALDEAAPLSEVEELVLRLVAGLHSNEQIGKELSISIDDVGSIKSDAMQKAGLATRAQVVEYVRRRGRK